MQWMKKVEEALTLLRQVAADLHAIRVHLDTRAGMDPGWKPWRDLAASLREQVKVNGDG